MRRLIRTMGAGLLPALVFLLLAAPALAAPEDEIRTLLPKDGIPSIDNPKFALAKEADKFMQPDEMIIGLDIGGDRRA